MLSQLIISYLSYIIEYLLKLYEESFSSVFIEFIYSQSSTCISHILISSADLFALGIFPS